jgi:hypothetical protein
LGRSARRATTLRQRLEAAVERAIAALDALDGDPDMEPECEDEGCDPDREPYCGWAEKQGAFANSAATIHPAGVAGMEL